MIEFFKTKLVAALLSFMFIISVFSGICVQNMDMDGGMAMVHASMEQEHKSMDHPHIACKKACEVTTYTSQQNDFLVAKDVSVKLFFLADMHRNVAIENLFASNWEPPPIQAKTHAAGGYQEGIKLLI